MTNDDERPLSVEEQLLRVKELAHDINNALMSCSGAVQSILRNTPQESTQSTRLHLLQSGLKDAATLVSELSQTAKTSVLKPSELSAIVSQVCDLYRESLSSDVKLLASIPSDVHVNCDSGRLKRAILNILSNAREAIEECGEIEVHLKVHATRHVAVIEIRDSGHGMSQETIQKILTERYSSKGSTTTRGYGLKNVRSIIKEHQGILSITSEPGKGSLFTIELPLSDSAEKETAETIIIENSQVLLVEVGGKIHSTLRPFLQKSDINITSFSNFESAYEWYQGHNDSTSLVFLYAATEEQELLKWFPKFQIVDAQKPVLISSPQCSQVLKGLTGKESLHCINWPLNYIETTDFISSLVRH